MPTEASHPQEKGRSWQQTGSNFGGDSGKGPGGSCVALQALACTLPRTKPEVLLESSKGRLELLYIETVNREPKRMSWDFLL